MSLNDPEPKWREYTVAAPSFVPPEEHTSHTVTPCGKNLVFLGGLQQGYLCEARLFVLDLVAKKWSQVKLPPDFIVGNTPSIYGHTATLVDDRVIFVGGFVGWEEEYCPTKIFAFDVLLQEFAYIETYGYEREDGAASHSAHYLYETNEVIVYGGENEEGSYSKYPLLSLNVRSFTWSKMTPTGKLPAPRSLHGSCLVGRKIYVFGGLGPNDIVYDDMHILDMTHRMPSFSQLDLGWIPTPRFGATMFYLHGQMYLFGGKSSNFEQDHSDMNIRLHDLWRFRVAEQAWYECESFRGRKHPRRTGNHEGVLLNNTVLIFGGTQTSLREVIEIRLQ